MRWPWQKRKPDPVDDEIAERMAEHQATLERAGTVLTEARTEIKHTAAIMDEYVRAEEARHRR